MENKAKEKAEQLFNKYWSIGESDGDTVLNREEAIECALICVDELIRVTHTDPFERKKCRSIFDKQYWQEVKQEIERL